MNSPLQKRQKNGSSILVKMSSHKILSLEELNEKVKSGQAEGKKMVHCHGVFDLLHIGHIKHFEEAKSFGDALVVTITPDEFVNKGSNRPAFTTELRLEALAALESVDFVAANKWLFVNAQSLCLTPPVECITPLNCYG